MCSRVNNAVIYIINGGEQCGKKFCWGLSVKGAVRALPRLEGTPRKFVAIHCFPRVDDPSDAYRPRKGPLRNICSSRWTRFVRHPPRLTAGSDVVMIDAPPDGNLVATLAAGTEVELIETLPHGVWLRVFATIEGVVRQGYVRAAPFQKYNAGLLVRRSITLPLRRKGDRKGNVKVKLL